MGVFDKFLDIMKLNDDDYDDDEFYDDDDLQMTVILRKTASFFLR